VGAVAARVGSWEAVEDRDDGFALVGVTVAISILTSIAVLIVNSVAHSVAIWPSWSP